MKKSFLTSLSILASAIATNASATLPERIADKIPEPQTTLSQASTPSPFVLDRPSENGGLFVAGHTSHSSHSSHRSHYSSR